MTLGSARVKKVSSQVWVEGKFLKAHPPNFQVAARAGLPLHSLLYHFPKKIDANP